MNAGDVLNVGETLERLKINKEKQAELNKELKTLKGEAYKLEADLMEAAEASGLESLSANGLTVRVVEDFHASYEPENWPDLIAGLVRLGYAHVVQKRISVAPVKAMIDNGVELPAGLKLVPFKKLSIRAK